MDRALAQPISDLERIDAELARLAPPQPPRIYRCHNTACRWEGDAALYVFNEEKRRDETRCPKCGTWICGGIPMKKAEMELEDVFVEHQELVSSEEMRALGFYQDDAEDAEFTEDDA